MNYIDIVVLLFVGLGIYAEATRGLFFALFDILRIVVALALGMTGYTLLSRLTNSYGIGLGAFLVLAFGVVLLTAMFLKYYKYDPGWNKTVLGRIGGGIIGCGVGLAICAVLLPVLGRVAFFEGAIESSPLGRRFLDAMPGIYYTADVLNLQIPQLTEGRIQFLDEYEGKTGTFSERLNYRSLDGATCIECGGPARFEGYVRMRGAAVSPSFACTECGRTSDGCQTFEGFHAMYDRCPYDVARMGLDLDCGVWPNNRAVQPTGACPVCGQSDME